MQWKFGVLKSGMRNALISIGAVMAAGIVALQIDSHNTGISKKLFNKFIARKPLRDEQTPIIQQVAEHPASHYAVSTLCKLIGITDDISRHTDLRNVQFESPIPGEQHNTIHLETIAVAHNPQTSLKAAAFYNRDTGVLMLLFAGMVPEEDISTIMRTLHDQPVPTQADVKKFMQAVQERTNMDESRPIKKTLICGYSLGAGSAIYALNEARGQRKLYGETEPKAVLIEGWKARAAAEAAGADIAAMQRHITEVVCMYGTHTAQGKNNPPVGGTSAVIVTSPQHANIFERLQMHHNLYLHKFLSEGHASVVPATPEEIAELHTTHTAGFLHNLAKMLPGGSKISRDTRTALQIS